jgi:hypothetical protein
MLACVTHTCGFTSTCVGTHTLPSAPHTTPTQVYNTYRFGFDRVYGPDSSQEDIYAESARTAVSSVLLGYNASIIAFGQTGTGKT